MISIEKKKALLAAMEATIAKKRKDLKSLEARAKSLRQELCNHEWKYKQIAGEGSYCIHCDKEDLERD